MDPDRVPAFAFALNSSCRGNGIVEEGFGTVGVVLRECAVGERKGDRVLLGLVCIMAVVAGVVKVDAVSVSICCGF